MLGVVLTAWITEDGDYAAWPKKEENAGAWLKSKRTVKSPTDLKRNWVMEPIAVQCYAGITLSYMCYYLCTWRV